MPACEKASLHSIKCHQTVYLCEVLDVSNEKKDWDFKCKRTGVPGTFTHYKCSDDLSQECRLTLKRKECDYANAHSLTIEDTSPNDLKVKLSKYSPNGEGQTGRYHKEGNNTDFRVFLGLTISFQSVHKILWFLILKIAFVEN